jgi:hypothetical protein
MNSSICENFRKDFALAMKDLEKKYGVSVSLGNIRFDNTSFSSKIEVQETTNVPSFIPSNLITEYNDLVNGVFAKFSKNLSNCKSLKDAFDNCKTAKIEGRNWVVIGYSKRARKSPFLVMDDHFNVCKISENTLGKYFL